MRPVEIVHYVERSYEGKPSFVILMSDGKEYVSNGCVFLENTWEKRARLISWYDCEVELRKLLKIPGIGWDELVNGQYMFRGCKALTEPAITPKLENGANMYYGCSSLKEPAITPELVNGDCMYYGCKSLKEPAITPKLVNGFNMYDGCPFNT
ncbi:MAG TPA: hypothetical protein ENJ30_12610 [Desulfobulbaceae bacterium]|nr:hypothetical protein [Desulfobulbaceae bacterium]